MAGLTMWVRWNAALGDQGTIQEYREVTTNESNFKQGKTGDREEDADKLAILPSTGLSQGIVFP